MKSQLPAHPTQLYLIRHGEVEHRYHRIFGGSRIDMELSPLGHQQARAAADWLEHTQTRFDALYASPMRRVQQTLAPLAEAHSLSPVWVPDFREMDFGEWTGHSWDSILENFGISAYDWLEVIETTGIPKGETMAELAGRVGPALLKILQDHPHGRVAIYCHGGIIRVMLSLLLGKPLADMAHFNVQYGSISIVEIQPDKKHRVEIEQLNFCPPVAKAV